MYRTVFTWANVLTLIRLLAIAPLALCIVNQLWSYASVLFALAVITDVYDGKLARRLGQTSAFGGLFDHSTDAIFVTVATAACAYLELINPYLPVLIMLAFMQYMLDSNALSGVSLRTSSLGKFNGVAYFVLTGTIIGAQLLELDWLMKFLPAFAWALVCSTLASMLDRMITLIAKQRRV